MPIGVSYTTQIAIYLLSIAKFRLTAGNAGPQALQLAVTPKQAQTLAWYQQHGTLTVVGDPWGVAP